METFAEDAGAASAACVSWLWERGEWTSTVVAGKEDEGAKFSDYFSATEPVQAAFRRTACWRCCAAARKASCGWR